MTERKILDIGCGKNKLPGSVGIDIVPLEGVDVVHDLNQFPYPFSDNTFDQIRMIHVIEHLHSVVKTMDEVHRIAKPGAVVEITTPHHTDASSWQDPTHIWHLNSRSFDYLEEDFQTHYYSQARFAIRSVTVKLLKIYKLLGFEALVNLQNRHPRYRCLRRFWEQHLCYLMRGKVMEIVLIAEK
jgi:predicted SAM-dependent methyltransferase